MGKGDRRGKNKPMPELEQVKRRERNGRAKRPPPSQRQGLASEDGTVLRARCRAFGLPDTQKNRKALSAPYSGSPLGMCIQRMTQSNNPAKDHHAAMRLWGVWQGLCAAERTYALRYIGQSGNPKGAALVMVPERVESDDRHTVDLRTSDERDRDAVSNWMRWRGYLGHLSNPMASALLAAYRGDGRVLWADCQPTTDGRFTFEALAALADVTEMDDRRRTG